MKNWSKWVTASCFISFKFKRSVLMQIYGLKNISKGPMRIAWPTASIWNEAPVADPKSNTQESIFFQKRGKSLQRMVVTNLRSLKNQNGATVVQASKMEMLFQTRSYITENLNFFLNCIKLKNTTSDRLGVWDWHVHTAIFKIKCLSLKPKRILPASFQNNIC